MTFNGWLQVALYCAVVVLLVKPFGGYMTRVFTGERTCLSPALGPLERVFYRLSGVDERSDQNWLAYAVSMLLFSLVSCLFTYAILRLQHLLPLNPQGLGPLSEHLAFNTAVSFTTNTNWQSYVGETTMSYLSQMVALANSCWKAWMTSIGPGRMIAGLIRSAATSCQSARSSIPMPIGCANAWSIPAPSRSRSCAAPPMRGPA